MNSVLRPRWLLVLAIAAFAFVAIRLTARWLQPSAHQRLVQQHCNEIRALSEERAALLVSQLAESSAEWTEVLLIATTDERPVVASTAERELRNLVLRLSRLSAEESSSAVADLARLLVTTAGALPPDRRSYGRSLAERLIAWPIDGRVIDSAQFLADCEAVLLLPVTEPVEIRVAQTPPHSQPITTPSEGPELTSAEPPLQPPPAVLVSEAAQPSAVLVTDAVQPPAPAPKSPNEPERFVPGRTLRISDE